MTDRKKNTAERTGKKRRIRFKWWQQLLLIAGTTGLARRAEAIDVQVLPQGQVPRGYDTSKASATSQSAAAATLANATALSLIGHQYDKPEWTWKKLAENLVTQNGKDKAKLIIKEIKSVDE